MSSGFSPLRPLEGIPYRQHACHRMLAQPRLGVLDA